MNRTFAIKKIAAADEFLRQPFFIEFEERPSYRISGITIHLNDTAYDLTCDTYKCTVPASNGNYSGYKRLPDGSWEWTTAPFDVSFTAGSQTDIKLTNLKEDDAVRSIMDEIAHASNDYKNYTDIMSSLGTIVYRESLEQITSGYWQDMHNRSSGGLSYETLASMYENAFNEKRAMLDDILKLHERGRDIMQQYSEPISPGDYICSPPRYGFCSGQQYFELIPPNDYNGYDSYTRPISHISVNGSEFHPGDTILITGTLGAKADPKLGNRTSEFGVQYSYHARDSVDISLASIYTPIFGDHAHFEKYAKIHLCNTKYDDGRYMYDIPLRTPESRCTFEEDGSFEITYAITEQDVSDDPHIARFGFAGNSGYNNLLWQAKETSATFYITSD